jgi:flap endonuclease-1
MGVQLSGLVTPKPISFKELAGKTIAIDAMNSLYQFLAIIRQPTGEPLKDSRGNITSHLSGLFYRNINMIEYGIRPVYVFDGRPHELKEGTIKKRTMIREEAGERWKAALERGDLVEARTAAQQASRFSPEMIEDSKRLLELMGIPVVQAPSEGEAQAAYMVSQGDAWAVGSQDYDSLLCGGERLVRNLTVSGRRKLPRKNVYVDVNPEVFILSEVLADLGITREQLVEISILVGTDYNPKGVEGLGPKKAYKLVKEYGTAARALEEKGASINFDLDRIRRLFLESDVTGDYDLGGRAPDLDGIKTFLCGEKDFSTERVEKSLERLEASAKEARAQASLDSFFG